MVACSRTPSRRSCARRRRPSLTAPASTSGYRRPVGRRSRSGYPAPTCGPSSSGKGRPRSSPPWPRSRRVSSSCAAAAPSQDAPSTPRRYGRLRRRRARSDRPLAGRRIRRGKSGRGPSECRGRGRAEAILAAPAALPVPAGAAPCRGRPRRRGRPVVGAWLRPSPATSLAVPPRQPHPGRPASYTAHRGSPVPRHRPDHACAGR